MNSSYFLLLERSLSSRLHSAAHYRFKIHAEYINFYTVPYFDLIKQHYYKLHI
jgi:hypothetical protein